jgi:threonine synthase
MDILVSSNLERLLFDIADEDPEVIKKLIADLSEKGEFSINKKMKKGLKDFYGGFATEEDTFGSIEEVYRKYDYLIDTHTAVGYSVYKRFRDDTGDDSPVVIASTASPFKFPGSVAGAIDSKYRSMDEFRLLDVLSEMSGTGIPGPLSGIEKKEIIHKKTCSTGEMMDVVAGILGV